MKTNILKMAGLVSALGAASYASAAEAAYYLHVNVPFAFVVAGQQFAAGEYDIKETNTGIITVQGAGGAAEVLSTPLEAAKEGEHSRLRFTTTESGAHLVSVSVEGEGTRSVPAHLGQERKLALATH